jgi:CRP-like cAMP-binding protein
LLFTDYIQALSTCTIGFIEAMELEKISDKNTEFFQASALIITKLFKDKLQQQIFHATLPGLKKLTQFRSNFPCLENHIPHSYISSYLGITNVSLSRLRKHK